MAVVAGKAMVKQLGGDGQKGRGRLAEGAELQPGQRYGRRSRSQKLGLVGLVGKGRCYKTRGK